MKLETAFTMDTSSIKYGQGVTSEIGYDMEERGCRRVMVVTDRYLGKSDPVAVTMDALRGRGIDAVLFDQSSVEPTDVSFKEAVAFAVNGKFDGYVAVGGGSEAPFVFDAAMSSVSGNNIRSARRLGSTVPAR